MSLLRAYHLNIDTTMCAHETRNADRGGGGFVLARSAKFLLALIKNAQANAEVNGLDKDELFVKNIVVQQAPKMRYVHGGRESEKSASY